MCSLIQLREIADLGTSLSVIPEMYYSNSCLDPEENSSNYSLSFPCGRTTPSIKWIQGIDWPPDYLAI